VLECKWLKHLNGEGERLEWFVMLHNSGPIDGESHEVVSPMYLSYLGVGYLVGTSVRNAVKKTD
jgi:hypothetical protein